MNTINEVIAELLGSYKLSFYITYSIFVILGIVVSFRINSLGRDKLSTNTPIKFNFIFLLWDNLTRFIGSLAFVFLMIRIGEDNWGMVPTYGAATIMGLCFDQALLALKKVEDKARVFFTK